MAGMGSYLPVAFLLLWLPGEYLNSALCVTWFWWLVFFFFSEGKVVSLEKYLIALALCLNAFEEPGLLHVQRELL